MIKEAEFKAWLEQGGAQTEKGRNSRAYGIRTIERKLQELGLPFRDLEAAWNADRFATLRERLRRIREDARNGAQDYRILMPESEKPQNRLSNWINWLGQYERFLAGEPPGSSKDADRIRQYALEQFIEPAREQDQAQVDIPARAVGDALGLVNAWPSVCNALGGQKFQEVAEVPSPEVIGPNPSSTTIFRYRLDDTTPRQDARPFVLYDAAGNAFRPVRHHNRTTGVSAFRIKPRGAGNTATEAIETQDIQDVARAVLVDGLAARIKAFAGGPVNYLIYGRNKLVRYELDPEIARAIGVPPRGSIADDDRPATDIQTMKEMGTEMTPVNLILYGPPGTGKTYATAAEALRLCGEPVPGTREELMKAYQQLVAAGRVEFVTFHQSMSYEDFVEGRQPMTTSDDESGSSTAGFRLETVPGIFRRIAKRAETSRGRLTDSDAISVSDRQVFKMSIGAADNPEDAHLFEEAIEGGYAVLGFSDIDWSDEKYADRDAMIAACRDHDPDHANVDARSGTVLMPFIFRNRVHNGDIVVVSKGNLLFRAIGEFTGDYEFHPRPEGDYAHRRAVRWLWVDPKGVPVSEIYSRRFSQKSIYLLSKGKLDSENELKSDSELNFPALERYMNSQRSDGAAEPEPFVLIIDEINRANISKVFGELITLLEPDKRLGQPNELKVRLPYSGDEFGVPSNLHILGTMNTADRSIALLDTALRRRFIFQEMMPNPSVLDEVATACGLDLSRLLTTINKRIEYLYDREHQIGHAYFTSCSSRADVDNVMRCRVIPLLAEYFFEDWGKIAAVLGDLEIHDGPIVGGFLRRSVLKAPPGFEDGDALPRFRWEVRSESEGFDYARLIGA